MSSVLSRPLSGISVGISISESDDSSRRGFPEWQINRITLQIAAALMGQGASVVFGHDWRDDGVMEAVHDFALRMQASDGPLADPGAASPPLLQNLVPWPDELRLRPEERDKLSATLKIESAGLPDDLAGTEREHTAKQANSYTRARALTHLRRRLTERTQARICLGGRTRGSRGRYPGVIEEAYLSVEADQPVYMVGLLGGATNLLIDALERRPKPPGFGEAEDLDGIYSAFQRDGHRGADAERNPDRVWSKFGQVGVAGLSKSNKLTSKQNRELFLTPAVENAIELILLGLAKYKRSKAPRKAKRPLASPGRAKPAARG